MSLTAAVFACLAAIGADGALADSLPRTSGAATVPGLAAAVTVERDAYGVAVVRGGSRADVIRAQGYVHGQERFFQMDLARRLAAGRVAEIVGPPGRPGDEHFRRFRFSSVAERVVLGLPAGTRRRLEVYAEGVNAGLAELAAPPPEYAVLRVRPEPWAPRDSVLVLLAMFDVLHMNARLERGLGVMHAALPAGLVAFLTPLATRFAAPLLPHAEAYRPAAVPGPEVIDLRDAAADGAVGAGVRGIVEVPAATAGSNNWAIAGARSGHGGAILANDPHLRLTAPGIWYRVQLEWGDRRVAGLSLPGNPGVVIGTNGRVAWGFTNTGGDFQDLVRVEVDPDDPGRYRTPDGDEAFEETVEEIRVRGAEPVRLVLRRTRWGVVTGTDFDGAPLVLKWTALEPEMVNLRIVDMAEADSLEEAVAVARTWYGPSQNVLLADADGRIAWVVSGFFPRRVGFDGTRPVSWAPPGVGWDGPMDERHRPLLVDPADGLLFTANNRTVDVRWARRLGNGWDLATRARRIGELLREGEKLVEADLRAIQLDTRVALLDFYRDLILDVVAEDEADADLREARRLVLAWDGTAGVDQVAMPILVRLRRMLHARVIGPLVSPCRELDRGFSYTWPGAEEPVRRILEERPAHLLPPGFADFDALVAISLRQVLDGLAAVAREGTLAPAWGELNRAAIRHPLAEAAPAFADRLDMPGDPLPGHGHAVRVATSRFGASCRLVVSPGREGQGLLHIPAGQSGHPLSPHYRSSHRAWLEGRPTPLLAGPAESTLTLEPEAE